MDFTLDVNNNLMAEMSIFLKAIASYQFLIDFFCIFIVASIGI